MCIQILTTAIIVIAVFSIVAEGGFVPSSLLSSKLSLPFSQQFATVEESPIRTANTSNKDNESPLSFTNPYLESVSTMRTTLKQTATTVASAPRMAQRWKKSTKQLATLGPSSSSREMIELLFLAGADVFRLNFSHGSHEQKINLVQIIRKIEEKYSHPIAILGDLQGPKLRVGGFSDPNGIMLQEGQQFRFDLDTARGDNTRVMLPHSEILEASEIGHVLLVNDGKVKLTVTQKGQGYIDCIVNVGGIISNQKGVNTPDSVLDISPLTPKDRSDLQYMLDIGVDWIALSFVQRPQDIEEIQTLINDYSTDNEFKPAIMAKIEKPSCFVGDNLKEIVRLSDGIMVARGDLGVECAPEDVPLLQKQIIDMSRSHGKPVVVATQMLESMIETPTPTRAEASDVATAIYDGADAIMLSAESAAGKYPEESVAMQQRIINRVEGDNRYRNSLFQNQPSPDNTTADAIITAAKQIADTIKAKSIVCFSLRGSTVRRASKGRPSVPILAISPHVETARQLALSWGVYPELPKAGTYFSNLVEEEMFDYESPLIEEATEDFDLVLRNGCRAALKKGLVTDPDDLLVVTAGIPFGIPGAANIIRVLPAAGPTCWGGICRSDE